MEASRKRIVLSSHALEQARFRGCSEEEIREAIETKPWKPAELGRLECQVDYPYNQAWNNVHYPTKRVRPIFAEEDDRLVVVTVYVYYFRQGG